MIAVAKRTMRNIVTLLIFDAGSLIRIGRPSGKHALSLARDSPVFVQDHALVRIMNEVAAVVGAAVQNLQNFAAVIDELMGDSASGRLGEKISCLHPDRPPVQAKPARAAQNQKELLLARVRVILRALAAGRTGVPLTSFDTSRSCARPPVSREPRPKGA